ncbi:DNA adenine methylase [Luteibacter jiangsuensis]|uniref:Site-specific DNA-methyltransferase (adenine-specific) n=1 Tax=Luteibacter jiangsuensis TaxID=637577 RepID=A0ABT9T5Y0_9GAMM|nr:Dam family site-specific DNA-(adenine-N6)-methyltransferase [Luteibacter jiangsuensis]MDQ0011542.1 DNA adenine methylase [Luteibacter jiangsuensis]
MTKPDVRKIKSGPLLRWAGSKQRLVPRLAEYWNTSFKRYLEPFTGSAALFFHLDPKRACLNDINEQLIECYEELANDPDALHRRVTAISSTEEKYYVIRALDPKVLTSAERAARFIYLNRHCFNGIYRTNSDGKFNVPYGAAKAGAVPTIEKFRDCARAIARAQLTSLDFDTFLKKNVKSGDFVYLDPPYAVANRRIFRQYDKHSFGIEDVERLQNCLELIDSRGASFVVSYALSAEIKPIVQQWGARRVTAQRNVAGFAEHRRKAVEVIITNIKE